MDVSPRARIENLRAALKLHEHPKGGSFIETYRAPQMLGTRPVSTAIVYMLCAGEVSRLHRLRSDELWHFHEGGPLRIVELSRTHGLRVTSLGPDLAAGQTFPQAVAAGTWFGAMLAPGAPFALVGCTVSPGFTYADFELADRAAMLAAFPEHAALVTQLT